MWQREAKPITDDYRNLTTELMVLFSITSHPNPFKAIHTLTSPQCCIRSHSTDRRKTKGSFKEKQKRKSRGMCREYLTRHSALIPSEKLMRKHRGKSTNPAGAFKGQKVITLKDPTKSFAESSFLSFFLSTAEIFAT